MPKRNNRPPARGPATPRTRSCTRLARAAGPLLVAWLTLPACPLMASEPDAGRAVYERACQECHGEHGRGDGPKAERLGFRPRDLALGSFKCRSTPDGQLPCDDDLLLSVRNGLPGTPMTAQRGKLSDEEMKAVVRFIKGFSSRFGEEPAPACGDFPQAAPPDMIERRAAGEHMYRLLQCWKCHGVAGRGDGPSSKTLEDEWGQRIRVYNFTRTGKLKCGNQPSDIYRTLHTGLNGSPMPSYTAALLFGSDSFGMLDSLRPHFDAGSLRRLKQYLRAQPSAQEVNSLSASERAALESERTWALVSYLLSLMPSQSPTAD